MTPFDEHRPDASSAHDARLDDLIGRLAGDYNAPPTPPVDAMWTRIQNARGARPAIRRRHEHPAWHVLAASIAFLAVGVAVGHEWEARVRPVEHTAVHAAAPATSVASAPSAATSTTPIASPERGTGAEQSSPAVATTPREHDGTTRLAVASVAHGSRPQSDRATSAAPDTPDNGATTSRGSDAAYQLAVLRHFTAAEALLTSYRGARGDARADAQLAGWARDLLSQTRLLLDSPAARDPVRRKLLQDLELVLVQMTQLSPSSPALEQDLIDGSVRQNDLLPRLHSAVPAGGVIPRSGA